MKNLKRVLSLVLALMMALSLMAFSSSASAADSTIPVASKFNDYSDVDDAYKEAADVVVALGIIQGKDSGLDPEGNLTRAEAVIMIERVLLGDAVVESLSGSASSIFTDVGPSFPYGDLITYAANTGIVSGDAGSKQFFPSDELSVVAFGKILLGALGYDSDKQKYTGDMWNINVFRDMAAAGINLDGVTNMFDSLTRQQAMQMIFQTLQADMVTYASGSDTPTPVANDGSSDYAGRTATGSENKVTQFCERYYSNLKLTTSGLDGTDAFNRPIATWKLGNTTICETESNSTTATVTYTAKVNSTQVAKDLAGYTVTDTQNSEDVKINATGRANAETNIKFVDGADADSLGVDGGTTPAAAIAALTGNGILVEVYTEGTKISKVIVVDTALMSISRITNSQVTLSSVVKPSGIGNIAAVDDSNKCFTMLSSMAMGDYVLVTAAKDGNTYTVQTVAVPDVVNGAVTAKTSGSNASITVDGQRYSIVENDSVVSALSVSAENEVSLYLDTYGYAIYGKTTAAAVSTVNAVYVTAFYEGYTTWGKRNMFQGVLADGTIITGEYSNGPLTLSGNPALYIYTLSGSTYTLTAVSGANVATTGASAFKASQSITATDLRLNTTNSYNNNFFADNVNFIYVSGEEDNINVTTRTGVQSTAVTTNDYYVIGEDANGNYVVTAVFIKGAAVNNTNDIVYISSAIGGASTDVKVGTDGKTTLYGYKMYVNGESKTVYFNANNQSYSEGFYTYSEDETTGAATLTTATGDNLVTSTAISGVSLINGVYYLTVPSSGSLVLAEYNATDATVVDTRRNGTVNSMTALLSAAENQNVTAAIVANSDDRSIVTVYVLGTSNSFDADKTVSVVEEPITVTSGTTTVKGDVNADVAVGESGKVVVQGNVSKDAEITVAPGGKIVVEGECNATITVAITGTNSVSDALTAATTAVVNGVVQLPEGVVTANEYYSDAWGMYIFTYDKEKVTGSNNVLLTIKDDKNNIVYQEIDKTAKNGRIFIPTTPLGGWTSPDSSIVRYGSNYTGSNNLADGTYTVAIYAVASTETVSSGFITPTGTAIMSGSFTISAGE